MRLKCWWLSLTKMEAEHPKKLMLSTPPGHAHNRETPNASDDLVLSLNITRFGSRLTRFHPLRFKNDVFG